MGENSGENKGESGKDHSALKLLNKINLVIIGASAGGAAAAIEVIKHLKVDSPCVVMVQHMTQEFVELYSHRVASNCKMKVKIAADGDEIKQGMFYMAPGDFHLTVARESDGYVIRLKGGQKVSGHRPSVDVAFESAAKVFGKRAIGVILTGMGSDGALGLLEMRKKGAYTIGQNKATSMVYGMPKVAKEMGAVKRQLPLGEIGMDINFTIDAYLKQ